MLSTPNPPEMPFTPTTIANTPAEPERFCPRPPETLEDTCLPVVLFEDLLFKALLAKGVLSGREMASELCVPFKLIQPILSDLKNRMFIAHRTTAALGDFYYNLTELGKQTAMLAKEYSAYTGAVPVVYEEYVTSVHQQSIQLESPRIADLERAYQDILVPARDAGDFRSGD